MAYNKDRGDSPMRRRGPRRRKKVCAFCSDKEHDYIDYKDELTTTMQHLHRCLAAYGFHRNSSAI